jgi:SAM-dependent methyltransferase
MTNPRLAAPYLTPYLRAAMMHRDGFGSLLWANPETQTIRFDAIQRLGKLGGKSMLDVGCGRADLYDYLLAKNVKVNDYIGLEAVPALADAVERKMDQYPNVSVIRADFVAEPQRLFVAADVIVFSGSLNTLEESDFTNVIRRAFDAAAEAVVFNYLDSPDLAGAAYLRWRKPAEVMQLVKSLGPRVETLSDYLPGDSTVAVFKEPA